MAISHWVASVAISIAVSAIYIFQFTICREQLPFHKKSPGFRRGSDSLALTCRFFTGRFAQLPTDEPHELHPAGGRRFAHSLLVILHERLFR